MTKEDAKEMIKMLVIASGNDNNSSITPFVEDVLSIIDRIDAPLQDAPIVYPDFPDDMYHTISNKKDTYIDKWMHDKDMFRIHPENGPFYGNGPKDCYENPLPYCSSDPTKTSYDPNTGKSVNTATC